MYPRATEIVSWGFEPFKSQDLNLSIYFCGIHQDKEVIFSARQETKRMQLWVLLANILRPQGNQWKELNAQALADVNPISGLFSHITQALFKPIRERFCCFLFLLLSNLYVKHTWDMIKYDFMLFSISPDILFSGWK